MNASAESVASRLEQRWVIRAIAVALIIIFIAGLCGRAVSHLIPFDDSSAGRLKITALTSLVPAAFVALFIGRVAYLRFERPDILRAPYLDEPGSSISLEKAVLANTVEQAVLAIPTYAALAFAVPGDGLIAVFLLATLFAMGRVAFAVGYRRGAAGRAFGFALTFYPSLLGLTTAFVLLISS